MITIYFKEAKDKYDSVFDVMSHYFSIENDTLGRNPATYWADTGEEQCGADKNRSFDDLLLLAQYYIPEATIEGVVNALYKYNIGKTEGLIAVIYCGNIERFVVTSNRYENKTIDGARYVFGYLPPESYSKAEGCAANSQWELNEIKAMIKE